MQMTGNICEWPGNGRDPGGIYAYCVQTSRQSMAATVSLYGGCNIDEPKVAAFAKVTAIDLGLYTAVLSWT